MDVGEEGGEVVVELGVEVSLLDLGLLERNDVLNERNGEVIWFIVAVLLCWFGVLSCVLWNVRLWLEMTMSY